MDLYGVMVDCAEGTVRQFAQQPYRFGDQRYLRIGRINKIFVTHMHADHTMGIITTLRNVLGIQKPKASTPDMPDPPEPIIPKVEIFGPRGMRNFIRTILTLTHTRSQDKYCVHELLLPGESPSASARSSYPDDTLHESELPGQDLPCDADGFWRNICLESVRYGGGRVKVAIDAGPIMHRDPCIGYVVREVIGPPKTEFEEGRPMPAGRNLVILGDTSDAAGIIPLVNTPPSLPSDDGTIEPSSSGLSLPRVSLLVHEATDSFIPTHIDPNRRTGKNRTAESVETKAIEKGHSTPSMAGTFARQIGAERLVLNHIGARFPAPATGRPQTGWERFRRECITEIERQAEETWRPRNGIKAIAAWDFCTIVIPPNKVETSIISYEERKSELMVWDREDQPLQRQVWEREEEVRQSLWVPGPGNVTRDATTSAGDVNMDVNPRGREPEVYRYREEKRVETVYERSVGGDSRPPTRGRGHSQARGGPYEQRREAHTRAPAGRGGASTRNSANQKRENSGSGGYGRRGGPSRGGGRGGYSYSDKRPRNL
ncbi:unnamed protein product [Somion occarium]|uniref:Metallo-beta-lactamase domain-containing protein n=1 Tax=Somion occarium TaxID=3059160 RepID=A0ABP1D928_9APHY